MPRKRKVIDGTADSRERLVSTAARLFRVQGYHATGLNQIVEESQAPKGSLYHYFPGGKEQLGQEALRGAGQVLAARLSALGKLDPRDALDQLVEISIQDLETTDYRDACPIATVALETASQSPDLRECCSGIFARALLILEGWLCSRGLPQEASRDLALLAFSAYEGALLLSKVQRSPEPLRRVAGQIRLLLESALPPA